eukprot:GHVN01038949.1.p1 GENE.GHVN01038949.1~~GHVN01038949.1.p1  ORF type:complete len:221 (-),score=17.47 GHVN01038949.1:1157-1819(-)
MGTDIYKYQVLAINGRRVVIMFDSSQDSGLALSGDSPAAKAFWVSAVCESESGAFDLEGPACALANHGNFRIPTPSLTLSGVPEGFSMDELNTLLSRFGQLSSYGGGGSRWNASFRTLEQAAKCIEGLNGTEVTAMETGNNGTLRVAYEKLENGPSYITIYDYPESVFEPFIENVELLKVEYEDDYETHGYFETRAVYEITFTKDEYCEHLKVGNSWAGR